MIRFYLQERMAEKQFKEGKRVTLKEVSEATSINRATLSKMLHHRGYNTVTDNLDRLCKYFDCRLEEIAEFVTDEIESTNQ
ncbi:MAG: helix-turn-helix transcriptional regulator [Gammaproteobacteria bacterium]|nr:helix-turn-helix transcriptional regulator [Gammaproteobacteria bacterium]